VPDDRPSYWPKHTRARRRSTPSDPHYDAVAARAGHRCEYCKAPEWLVPARFHVEHVVPERWGGLTFPGNLALACPYCNDAKRTTLGLLDPATELPVWLFNPRGADRWDDHFAVVLSTGRIEGRTDTGRTTIECLKMNHPRPLTARQLWILAGYYP
jgi:hypothetical protein